MSFRVLNRDTGEETGKLRGNVVLGRKGIPIDYDDGRFSTDNVTTDEFERLPGILYDRSVSRNHVLVAENPNWLDESLLDTGAVELRTGQMDLDVWDLESVSGTSVEEYDPGTGHPVYDIGGHSIEVRPLNHYFGIAGPDDKSLGVENNVESMAANLDSRGFETDTVTEASWDEVDGRLERLENATEEESSTLIMYTGHGYSTGHMSLDDRKVDPGEFIERIDDLSGDKVVVVDQCYAGSFDNYSVPDDMTVYMASDAGNPTQGNSVIAGEKRTRYAGRIVEELESERGHVDMDDIHGRVASVSKVADNNPRKRGPGSDISSIK